MIHLITGQPGAGKTLYALHYVQRLAVGGRQVYYNGIPELKLPWIELPDPERWYEVPSGAVVVIDEAQRVFRPRAVGSQVPRYVAELETHRHKGIDLVLITQHPMLADTNVRRLVGRHLHVVRTFGMERATIHEWGEVREQCDKNRQGSVRHEFAYPRESYRWYKSAEAHTHKRRIPARLYILAVVPVLLALCVWYLVEWWEGRELGPQVVAATESAAMPAPVISGPGEAGRGHGSGSYLDRHAPRVPGLAYTAPVFDRVTEPVEAPYPAACLASGVRCSCYSQQGTALDMPSDLCRQIVARGFFVSWRSQSPAPLKTDPTPRRAGGGEAGAPAEAGGVALRSQ